MAKILSKSTIVSLGIIRPWHVSQSIDAFAGTDAYDITLSGSMTMTGDLNHAISGQISGSTRVITNTVNTPNIESSTGNINIADNIIMGGNTNITASGPVNYSSSGDIFFNPTNAAFGTSVLTIDPTTGQVYRTGSYGGGSGGSSTLAAGNNFEIQYNSASAFQAINTFRFNYFSQSLEQGLSVTASGEYSHAEGHNTLASARSSHAEGYTTSASGQYSHAAGYGTEANGTAQSVIGIYNLPDTSVASFIVGNGPDTNNRSNLIHASGSIVNITGSMNVTGSMGVTGSLLLGQGSFSEDLIKVNNENFLSTLTGFYYVGNTNNTLQFIGQYVLFNNGHITASVNISSSANVIAKTGSFSHLQGNSPFTIGDQVTFQQPITSSGNISSSGTFIGDGSTLTNLQRPISNSVIFPFTASNSNSGYYFRAGGNVTCSIQSSSLVSCNIGNEFEIFQTSSAGYVLFLTGSGVTLNSKGGNIKLAGQFSAATLKKVGNDEWDLIGDLG